MRRDGSSDKGEERDHMRGEEGWIIREGSSEGSYKRGGGMDHPRRDGMRDHMRGEEG